MPWLPELFSAPALQQLVDERRREDVLAVPYFYGFLAGEPDALIESFAGEPTVFDPVRGRVRGVPAFRSFAAEMTAWLDRRNVTVEPVNRVIVGGGGFEETIVHIDADEGRVALPFAAVTEREADGRIAEVRVYHSNKPLAGGHARRAPLLQPDPELRATASVAAHQRALAGGDVEAIVAGFEPDGYVRGAGGADDLHRGPDGLRAFYDQLLSDGGIVHEHCAIVGNGEACVVEYNLVRWGATELLPQAGAAAYVTGQNGRLAAVRIYDDVEPPPSAR